MRFVVAAIAMLSMARVDAARAADSVIEIGQYNQRVWSIADGLPQATVTAVIQTPDGYLWVGTSAGLARFDGVAFTAFSVDNTPILRGGGVGVLVLDETGQLLVGLEGGAGLVRYKDGVFEDLGKSIEPTFRQLISTYTDHRGRRWFGGWRGLLHVENGKVTVISKLGARPPIAVRAIAEDREGHVFVDTYTGVWREDGAGWQRVDRRPAAGDARCLLVEADGTEWIGTGDGLVRWRGGEARVFTVRDGLPHQTVTALLRDRQGNLWIGTAGGLGRLRGERIESDAPARGVFDQFIMSLFQDREGNLWLGTRGGGLVRMRAGPFVSVLPPDGRGHLGTAITGTPDGTVWVGTEHNGLLRVQGSAVSTFTTADGLCTNNVDSLAVDEQGRLVVGGHDSGRGGVCRLEGGTFRALGSGQMTKPTNTTRALLRTRTGVLVAVDARLYRVHGDSIVLEPLPAVPRAGWPADRDGWLVSLLEDHAGTLWVAKEGVLLSNTGGGWRPVGEPPELPRSWIEVMYEGSRGGLWLGTRRGLRRLVDGKLLAFGRNRGLFEDRVNGIAEDDDGDLWVCSVRGFLRVARGELEAVDRGERERVHYSAYRAADGLATDTCEAGGIWKAPDGRLWFATGRGAAYVDPAALRRNRPEVPLVIERVTFDDLAVQGEALGRMQRGRGDLVLSYAALTLTAPEKVRYRHRLEPMERAWVDGDPARSAHYLGVPAGEYVFRVVATLDEGDRELATALRLRVLPGAWERWRVTLGGLALVALGAGLVWIVQRARLRRVQERHRLVLDERTRLARDLHDTLSQSFTALALQIEAANRLVDADPQKAHQSLDEARTVVQDSVAEMRRAIWALRPESLSKGDLGDALAALAARLGSEFPVQVTVEGPRRRLDQDREIALCRIGQEALTNALKHARAGRIALHVIFSADRVALKVIDDGIGLGESASDRPGHFGLRGIRERVQALGGRFEVRGGTDGGTEVVVELPAS